MAEVKLKASKRQELGKGPAYRSRTAGKVPGVIYGHGMDPLPIEVDRREFVTALHTEAGFNVLLDLDVDGTQLLALTKELQRDPLKGTVLHADFIQIDRTEEVQVEVPLHLIGHAVGAEEGGVVQQPRSSLNVRCIVTEVPQFIEADISALNIGDALRVIELTSVGFEILDDPDTVIASVAAPVSEEELEAMVAEAGIDEGEEVEGEEVEGEGEGEEGAEEEAGEGGAEAESSDSEEASSDS